MTTIGCTACYTRQNLIHMACLGIILDSYQKITLVDCVWGNEFAVRVMDAVDGSCVGTTLQGRNTWLASSSAHSLKVRPARRESPAPMHVAATTWVPAKISSALQCTSVLLSCITVYCSWLQVNTHHMLQEKSQVSPHSPCEVTPVVM